MFVKSQQEVSIDIVRACLKVFVRPGAVSIKVYGILFVSFLRVLELHTFWYR